MREAMVAIALAALLGSSGANAATYLFSLSGPNTASFSLDSSPTPDAMSTFPQQFTLNDVTGTYNGAPTVFDLTFFGNAMFGGFAAAGTALDLEGSALFTGLEYFGPGTEVTPPVFKLGTFLLAGGCGGTCIGDPLYTLSISDAASVPEPASWAMMLLGFAAISLRARLRRPRLITIR